MTVRVRHIVPNSYGSEHVTESFLTNVVGISRGKDDGKIVVTWREAGEDHSRDYGPIVSMKVYP